MTHVESASNDRTVNNAARHQYRVLTDEEKANMVAVKDKGAEFLALLDSLHTPPQPIGADPFIVPVTHAGSSLDGMAICTFDRELQIAKERIEEAVMWAVKHITA